MYSGLTIIAAFCGSAVGSYLFFHLDRKAKTKRVRTARCNLLQQFNEVQQPKQTSNTEAPVSRRVKSVMEAVAAQVPLSARPPQPLEGGISVEVGPDIMENVSNEEQENGN